jgi:hypothetical protein
LQDTVHSASNSCLIIEWWSTLMLIVFGDILEDHTVLLEFPDIFFLKGLIRNILYLRNENTYLQLNYLLMLCCS